MKKLIFLTAAFFILSSAANAEVQPRMLSVNGEAIIKTAPDQAVVMLTVQTENKDLKKAKQENDVKTSRLLATAKDYGITDENMQTMNVNIQPQYDYQPSGAPPKLRSYQAMATLQFKISPLDKVAGFTDEAVKAAIDRVDSIQYTIKDEQKVREDAMLKALQNASNKAQKMAGVLGITLGKPLQVSESGNIMPPPPRPIPMGRMMAMSKAEDMAAPDLPGGVIEVHQNVSVSYEIK